MVEYEYQDLFYKSHQTKDILIVDVNAVVTPVSGEPPIIENAIIEIHTEDIEAESFELDESICSEDNLRFGLLDSARVGFTIKNKSEIPNLKSTEYGDFLNVYIYFNGDSDTLFQIGQYICETDEYTSNRKKRNVELYDVLYTLNDLDITAWYNRLFEQYSSVYLGWALWNLFEWIVDPYDEYEDSPKINVRLDDEYTLTNGQFSIKKTIESDTITFGFFVQGLLEINGCFGHITRDGEFRCLTLESFDTAPVRTVTDDFRQPPTNYDDNETWGIGQIDVYDRTNAKKFSVQNTDKKKPSIYVMVDPWVLADRDAGDSEVIDALKKMHEKINHLRYNPSETVCSADLCVEVGDRINVKFTQVSEYDTRNWFRSYVLERHLSGIQSMKDTYSARGDKKQPAYQIVNDNWHMGDSTSATQGQGTGGVSLVDNELANQYIEWQRNYGLRLLDEPTAELVYNKSSNQVEITWTDPDDLIRYRPIPLEWAGTVVVRTEGKPPVNIWNGNQEGNVLVDSTTRDEYSENAFIDDTIEQNKRYYYGIFPYHIIDDSDPEHIKKGYRFTKVFSVDTAKFLVAPTIMGLNADGTDVNIVYAIPVLEVGTYSHITLWAKKNNIPTSASDADKTMELPYNSSMIIQASKMTGLDELTQYYFVIQLEDDLGNTATSEPRDIVTGEKPIVPTGEVITVIVKPYSDGYQEKITATKEEN